MEKMVKKTSNVLSPSYRQRSPFVPFAIKNDTGLTLYFATVIAEVGTCDVQEFKTKNSWTVVVPGETVPFSFGVRDKMRHQDSHKMKMHQLVVRVDGFQEALPPVSIDKVGIYFRHCPTELKRRDILDASTPQARIIFDVALEGSARKLVTIRSGLLIKNKLSQNLEIKLDSMLPHNSATSCAPSTILTIESDKTLAVPLNYAHSNIYIRPAGSVLKFTHCSPSILWTRHSGEISHELRTCHSHKGFDYRFCVEIQKEKYAIESYHNTHKNDQPAHRITLLPPVKIVNLLPVDLSFNIKNDKGRIVAGSFFMLTNVDVENVVELNILLENFKSSSAIIIPGDCCTDFTCRIRLEDSCGRKLYLQAVINCNKDAKVKIIVSAPYWIINRTGLPLIFRQGASNEAAGQFEENEVARLLTPLLFSFSDHDASPTINARVGKNAIKDGTPQWCSNFHVQKGVQVRKLRITMQDGRPDTVFVVGIEVRQGKGRYRSTHIVTISPRYQLHNRSSYNLIFCQSFFSRCYADPRSQKTCLRIMPNSYMPFHWPRLDQEQLLCVAIQEIPDCCWSGGLQIDANNSMHVNVRDSNGRVYFLRLEVVLQGATFFVVFTDADTMPPPIRVDNFSEVSLTFAQTVCKDFHHSTARSHSSVPYAWDQPTQSPFLTIVAPGGVTKTYDMNKLGNAGNIIYENFIYIAFIGTFPSDTDSLSVESLCKEELVLDVKNGNQVILARKRQGQRSQLWKHTPEGQLQHEGSSPPCHPNQPKTTNILVLDIENTAPQPNNFSRLVLRRIDPRRTSTQTWRFTSEGYLCCAHYNMCVQAQDGFYGLREGSFVVLGMPQPKTHTCTVNGIPIEQAISPQQLRPGSGNLSVEIIMDGPTRVLQIKDTKEKNMYATPDERDWRGIALQQRPLLNLDRKDKEEEKKEFQLTVMLEGLGLSVVDCQVPEELLYALYSNIIAEVVITPEVKKFCISIENVQIDNQLFDSSVPVVLYVTPPNSRSNDEGDQELPAILFKAEIQPQVNENAIIVKYLIFRLKKVSVILEELLLLKLLSFFGFNSQEDERLNKGGDDSEAQILLSKVTAAQSKRYYFGVLQLVPNQIRLSVRTAAKLTPDLQKIKKKLGLTLIKFEDAAVDLKAFNRSHPFETQQFLITSIIKHFKDELLWQAGIILGSVDFLGNPLGFVNDVTEGLSELRQLNVAGMVKNVTHGISNSAAKVTESLSDGLGKVAMDDHHEEIRQKIRQVETGKSKDHIVAGFKGLGFGLLGGFTSMFNQVYEGVSNDGIQGVFSGIGKGLVGTVTKPVVGVLDFASETARAVRDSSRSKLVFERQRPPRCVFGYGGLLPRYSLKQSQGQQYLYMVNDKNYKEQLISFEVLGSASEDLQCIISNERIRIVASNHLPDLTPIIDCHLMDLVSCQDLEEKEHTETRYYIELVMHIAGGSSSLLANLDPIKKPKVRCRSLKLARMVVKQINYAKRLYTEYLYTLKPINKISED